MIATNQSQTSQIEEILQQLDSGPLNKELENRRGAKRLNVRMQLEAVVLGGSEFCPIKIHTRNMSKSGTGFVSRRLLTSGERIAILLHIAGKPSKLLLAQVTFGRYVRSGMYEMGAKFLEAVDDPEGKGAIPPRWNYKRGKQVEPAPANAEPAKKKAAAPVNNEQKSEVKAPAAK